MKNYAPYLLYQIARFGALTVPQMLLVCDGKCKRSSLYRTLSELEKGHFVYPILNPASRTRAYYATREGRGYVLGESKSTSQGIRTRDLDHTLLCAQVLLDLGQYENVTGISTPFEMSSDEVKRFSHQRIPDGIFRLTQEGHHFELALEVESTARNTARVREVLEHYWKTFKHGMECSGLLIVAMDATIHRVYARATADFPEEFQSRVRLVQGAGLDGLRSEAYGQKLSSKPRCLELTRNLSMEQIAYSPVKLDIFSSNVTCRNPQLPGARL